MELNLNQFSLQTAFQNLIDRDDLAGFIALRQTVATDSLQMFEQMDLLHDAVFAQSESIIRYLLANGYDPNTHANRHGYTALHWVIFDQFHHDLFTGERRLSYWCDDWMPILRLLIASGADVNQLCYTGYTPLDHAEKVSLYDAIAILRAAKGLRAEECSPQQRCHWFRRETNLDNQPIPVLVAQLQAEGHYASTNLPMLACFALAKQVNSSVATFELIRTAFNTISHPEECRYYNDISQDIGEFLLLSCYASANPAAHALANYLIQAYSHQKQQAFLAHVAKLDFAACNANDYAEE
ncbi:ankyrin repeat domain-containing protein [Herpetosiphon llansteffanensis]